MQTKLPIPLAARAGSARELLHLLASLGIVGFFTWTDARAPLVTAGEAGWLIYLPHTYCVELLDPPGTVPGHAIGPSLFEAIEPLGDNPALVAWIDEVY